MIFKIRLIVKNPAKAIHLLFLNEKYFGLDMLKRIQAELELSEEDLKDVENYIPGIKGEYHEIEVPMSLALASGRFKETGKVVIQVDDRFLNSFVAYDAKVKNITQSIKSYIFERRIDEEAVLKYWEECGFPLFLNRPKIQDNE